MGDLALKHLQKIAECKYPSVEALISQALKEFIAKINTGKEQVICWEEIKMKLYDNDTKDVYLCLNHPAN